MIQNGNKLKIESELFIQETTNELLLLLSEEMNIKKIPNQLEVILHFIYIKIVNMKNKEFANKFLKVLFFNKFLIPSLKFNSSLIKKIEILLKRINGKLSGCFFINEDDIFLEEEEKVFIKKMNSIIYSIKNSPLRQTISLKNNFKINENESYNDIINILKNNLKELFSHYGDGFEEIFKLIKSHKDSSKGNVVIASQEYSEWMVIKEREMDEENDELIKRINQMKSLNGMLKNEIEKITKKK